MVNYKKKAYYRKINKRSKAYRDEYYRKNREKHNEDMRRRMVMAEEAGHHNKHIKSYHQRKKQKKIDRMVIIDGVTLFSRHYTLHNLINNLKYKTLVPYIKKGIIPEPIYIGHTKDGRKRYYFSQRQIDMINHLWSKKSKKMTLGEKSEYLHAHWTTGELGFGGESEDND